MNSRRQSSIDCFTSGWSGISRLPVRFSAQASWSGNTTASRSSESARWNGAGMRLPFRFRTRASAIAASQRQRVPNTGASSKACTSTSSAVSDLRKAFTSSSGKLCVGPSESTMLSSSAEAWSSKLNWRQKRLRSASPQARLMREPKVEWMTRWVSPTSSKKRSNTMVSSVGSVPSAAWPAARYWASC